MPREIRNVGASVRARLQNLSRETGQSFELILTRYALERLLYRLSTSQFSDRFVLKGAMLLTSWFADPHRATRDLDLLGFGDPSPEAMVAAFKEILAIDVEDGVEFDSNAVRVDQIREELEYGGLRLRTTASISGARIAVTVDVAFGDALEPGAEVIDSAHARSHRASRGSPVWLPSPDGRARTAAARSTFQGCRARGLAFCGSSGRRNTPRKRQKDRCGRHPDPGGKSTARTCCSQPCVRWRGRSWSRRPTPAFWRFTP